MEREELQQLIDTCTGAQAMVTIAREYLRGSVLRDPTAAEGWLIKAIASEDPVYSPRAMGILAREILEKDPVIPPEDVPHIQAGLLSATARERTELEELLRLL